MRPGMLLNPLVFVKVFALLLVLLVTGLFLPSFKGDVVDITVSSEVEWSTFQFRSGWSVTTPTYVVEDSRLINPSAWGQRAAFFGATEDHIVRFELVDSGGSVAQRVDRMTNVGWTDGRGGYKETFHAVFREVEPGAYTLRVSIVNPSGSVVTQEATSLNLVGGVA